MITRSRHSVDAGVTVTLVGMSKPKALVVFNPGPAAVRCAVSCQGLRRRKNWPGRIRGAA